MATAETTPSVRNYLGHPCRLAEALERFSDPLRDSRKSNEDKRALAQALGLYLTSINKRCDDAHDVAELARDRAEEVGEDDQLQALLRLQADHLLSTCNQLYEFAGMVLDALERADMVKPSQAKEASNG